MNTPTYTDKELAAIEEKELQLEEMERRIDAVIRETLETLCMPLPEQELVGASRMTEVGEFKNVLVSKGKAELVLKIGEIYLTVFADRNIDIRGVRIYNEKLLLCMQITNRGTQWIENGEITKEEKIINLGLINQALGDFERACDKAKIEIKPELEERKKDNEREARVRAEEQTTEKTDPNFKYITQKIAQGIERTLERDNAEEELKRKYRVRQLR